MNSYMKMIIHDITRLRQAHACTVIACDHMFESQVKLQNGSRPQQKVIPSAEIWLRLSQPPSPLQLSCPRL